MATRTVFALVALVAALVAAPILTAQFHGEDEVGVYVTANWLVGSIVNNQWSVVAQVLVGSYHPPGRFLLAMLSFFAFGPSLIALRLPAVIIWVVTCVLAADLTRRQVGGAGLAGTLAGLFTGLLLGASGLFSLQALGFGHGVLTFWVTLFIWLKVKNPVWTLETTQARRQYVLGSSILTFAFLWFTSVIPIVGMYHLYYFYRVLRQKNMEACRQYLLLTLPFVFFYAAYYVVFLGIPWYAVEQGWRDRPVGQLHQNLARVGSSRLNVDSFIENIRGINWYHVPFISWFLLAIGVVWQAKKFPPLVLILTPYALLFSFYIVDNTLQHFVSYYVWVLPFAVAALWQWATVRNKDWQRAVTLLLGATILAAAGWGYVTSARYYTEATYPYELEDKVFGRGKWRTNLVRPLPQISQDLAELLKPEDHWTVTIDGTLPLYYFPDSRYVPPETASCEDLRAYVRHRDHPLLCGGRNTEIITYPESSLELVVLPQ